MKRCNATLNCSFIFTFKVTVQVKVQVYEMYKLLNTNTLCNMDAVRIYFKILQYYPTVYTNDRRDLKPVLENVINKDFF